VQPKPTSPRKSPRQERSRRTVERILDASARIFQEDGYAGATTNEIACEAEVSVGSLYQYFPNKDAILVALTRRHIESATAGLVDLVLGLGSEAGIRETIHTVVNFLVEQHDLDELHLHVMHTAPRTYEINVELEGAKRKLVDMTSHFLASQYSDDHELRLVAQMVVATIDGGVHDVILRQPRGAARRAAIGLTVDIAVSIIEKSAGRKR
jgi:AcrR family transcriptional regulator